MKYSFILGISIYLLTAFGCQKKIFENSNSITNPRSVGDLSIEQVQPGNIFIGVQTQGPLRFKIAGAVKAYYTLKDAWGNIVQTGTKTLDGVQLNITDLPLGFYDITIQPKNAVGVNIGGELKTTGAILSPFTRPSSSPFSIQTHYGQWGDNAPLSDWKDPDGVDLMRILIKMGATGVRDQITMSEVFLNSGNYDWSRSDFYMNRFNKTDSTVNPIIGYGINKNVDTSRLKAFANATLVRYPFIKTIAGINEYNNGNPPTDFVDYFNVQRSLYNAIGGGNVKVNGIESFSGALGQSTLTWMDNLLAYTSNGKNINNYMNRVAIHTYCGGSEVEQLSGYIDIIKQKFPGKSIWITEMGRWTTDINPGIMHTDFYQACDLIKTYAIALNSGVERVNWYELKNAGIDDSNDQHNFGVIRSGKDGVGRFCPKIAYCAYATMTRMLGTAIVSPNALTGPLWEITFNGGSVKVVWNSAADEVYPLSGKKVYNLVGKEITPKPGDPPFTLKKGEPVFVK